MTFFHNQDTIAPRQLVQALGLEDCSFQVMSALGGGWACAAVATASMAIHAGICRNVLVFRAMKGRSERQPARPHRAGRGAMVASVRHLARRCPVRAARYRPHGAVRHDVASTSAISP